MGRSTLRLMAVVVVMLALLAACGSDDDGGGSSATGKAMSEVSANQLVGQWMDSSGEMIEFNRDGSISGYSEDDFEAATYTIANADGESLLLLNTTNGSVYAREFTLTEIKGCDDHAFAFLIEGADYRDIWWFVGTEDFEAVTASELRAHIWNVDAMPGYTLRFENGGKIVSTYEGETVEGTWQLDGNNLIGGPADGNDTETEVLIRVARCDGKPLVIAADVGEGYTSFLSDPSVTPNME